MPPTDLKTEHNPDQIPMASPQKLKSWSPDSSGNTRGPEQVKHLEKGEQNTPQSSKHTIKLQWRRTCGAHGGLDTGQGDRTQNLHTKDQLILTKVQSDSIQERFSFQQTVQDKGTATCKRMKVPLPNAIPPDYPKQASNLNLITLNIKLLKENIRENLCYLGYMTPKA